MVLAITYLWLGIASPAIPSDSLDTRVQQLRQTVGEWDVVTEFLNPDSTVRRAAIEMVSIRAGLESRMEYTLDDGKVRKAGKRKIFVRKK